MTPKHYLSNDVLLALVIHRTLYLELNINEQRVFGICCFYLIVTVSTYNKALDG